MSIVDKGQIIANNNGVIAENVVKVYEKGEKVGHADENLLWFNMITGNGTRTSGTRMFNECNLDGVVFPKPISGITMAGRMFYYYRGETLPSKESIDLSKVDVNTTSTSSDYSVNYAFVSCRKVKYIPDYNIQAPYQYLQTYANNTVLEEIELIRCNENTVWNSTFLKDSSLTTIHFEGVIGTSISFSESPLSVESQKDAILHLKDYSGTSNEYKHTVTFNASVFSVLEAEGATAKYNGVPCTWVELIDNKKWNLVKG